jgi:histidinol-phosphate phosphatase family protein
MNRAVFLDRDGTIAKDVHYCRRPEDFVLFTDAAKVISLLNNQGFKVIIITNQSGIAHGYLSEETLGKIHDKMKEELSRDGARLDGIYYCPHHPDANCNCRKPKPSLVIQAATDFDIDLEHSFVVGDRQKDIELGKKVGCRTILLGALPLTNHREALPDAIISELAELPATIFRLRNSPGVIAAGGER